MRMRETHVHVANTVQSRHSECVSARGVMLCNGEGAAWRSPSNDMCVILMRRLVSCSLTVSILDQLKASVPSRSEQSVSYILKFLSISRQLA